MNGQFRSNPRLAGDAVLLGGTENDGNRPKDIKEQINIHSKTGY